MGDGRYGRKTRKDDRPREAGKKRKKKKKRHRDSSCPANGTIGRSERSREVEGGKRSNRMETTAITERYSKKKAAGLF